MNPPRPLQDMCRGSHPLSDRRSWLPAGLELGKLHRRPKLDLVEHGLQLGIARILPPAAGEQRQLDQGFAADRAREEGQLELLELVEEEVAAALGARAALGDVVDLLEGEDRIYAAHGARAGDLAGRAGLLEMAGELGAAGAGPVGAARALRVADVAGRFDLHA